MPSVQPVAATPPTSPDVRAAISRAAEATGVDFDYLLAQARIESGLDPDAKARTSSATGLYQFIDSTWLRTLDRHGGKYGFSWAQDQIGPGGRVQGADTRAQILSLRYDADISALMAAELARDNAAGLKTTLGREPNPSELYLAHFLGLGGANTFIRAYQTDAGQSAVALMPQAAAANRPIFYDGRRARSVAEVMSVINNKVARAMEQGGAPVPFGLLGTSGPSGLRPEFEQAQIAAAAANRVPLRGGRIAAPPPGAPPEPRSMADTLRSTFGSAEEGSIAATAQKRVAAAYAKFEAFGL